MAHLSDEDLILYYYAESPDPGRVGRHIEVCDECRARFEELETVLKWSLPAPEPGADYSQRVWRNIERRLPARGRRHGVWWWPRWAVAGATLALALFVASLTRPPVPGLAPSAGTSYREALLAAETQRHLERSERFLVEALNGSGAPSNLDAGELLHSNRLLRRAAEHAGITRLALVLEDLEFVLAESANAGPGPGAPEAPEREVLFRVRTLGDLLQARELSHVQRH